jgi:hypothetical protein
VDVADFFAGHMSITMIKDMAQTGLYWPAFNINTLVKLYPGRAYQVYNTGSPVIIKYPKCEIPNLELKDEFVEVQSPWNVIVKTPSSHIFGFDANALALFEQDDIIGAFTQDGRCAGIVAVNHQAASQALVAFAGDPISADKDGFDQNEPVTFRVFKNSTNEEFLLDVGYAPQSPAGGLFEHDGISIIDNIDYKTSSIESNAIGDVEVQMHVYPNPTSGQVNIVLNSARQIAGEISITNLNGQLVNVTDFDQPALGSKMSVDMTGYPRGIYYLRITSDRFTKTEKIVLD